MVHKYLKEDYKSKAFDVILVKAVPIMKSTKYDIALTWNCSFQSKNGTNGKGTVGMITFSKSSYDNNGTSESSGQIAGLLVNAKR